LSIGAGIPGIPARTVGNQTRTKNPEPQKWVDNPPLQGLHKGPFVACPKTL
jgi:hypothetical protein